MSDAWELSNEGPLERVLAECKRQKKTPEVLDALTLAIALGGGPWIGRADEFQEGRTDFFRSKSSWKDELLKARGLFRREKPLSPQDIQMLAAAAKEAGESSFFDWYVLMEIVDAAAASSLQIMERIQISYFLALPAEQCGQMERARQVWADCLESVQVVNRLALAPPESISKAMAIPVRHWQAAKPKYGAERELFDTESPDPAETWFDILLWNTDLGSEHGILSQVEATLRLAVRFEDHIDRLKQPLDAPIAGLLSRCLAAADSGTSLLPARLGVALGDALIEVQKWDLAAGVFQRLLRLDDVNLSHPLWIHIALQEIYARLMGGPAEAASALLESVDFKKISTLADIILTVKAELARYHALRYLCAARTGKTPPQESRTAVNAALGELSILSTPNPATRTEMHRSMFVAVLKRDLDYILASI